MFICSLRYGFGDDYADPGENRVKYEHLNRKGVE